MYPYFRKWNHKVYPYFTKWNHKVYPYFRNWNHKVYPYLRKWNRNCLKLTPTALENVLSQRTAGCNSSIPYEHAEVIMIAEK